MSRGSLPIWVTEQIYGRGRESIDSTECRQTIMPSKQRRSPYLLHFCRNDTNVFSRCHGQREFTVFRVNDNIKVLLGYKNYMSKKHKYVVGCFRIALFQIRVILGYPFFNIYLLRLIWQIRHPFVIKIKSLDFEMINEITNLVLLSIPSQWFFFFFFFIETSLQG